MKNRNEASTFLCIVKNPNHYDSAEIDEDLKLYVTLVLAGYYLWLDSDMMNTMSGKYRYECLNIISYSPQNKNPIKYRESTIL